MHRLTHGSRFGSVFIVFIAAAVASLTLAGCGDGGKSDAAAVQTTSPEASWSRPDAPPDPHTLLRAAALATTQVPGGVLIFIESQTNDVGTWKARLVTSDGTEQQVKMDSDGMSVLVPPAPLTDAAADKAKRRANVAGAKLDYQAAVDKALGEVPNGSITELSLVDMNGTVVWEAEVWDTDLVEHDVTIDAATGAVTGDRQI